MVKSSGHIDVVFRNGLKNLEVLPPADLWDNLSPALSNRSASPWYFLKVAAGVAAIVSLSVAAFIAGSRALPNAITIAESNSQALVPEMTDFNYIAAANQVDAPIIQALDISENQGRLSAAEIESSQVIAENDIYFSPAPTADEYRLNQYDSQFLNSNDEISGPDLITLFDSELNSGLEAFDAVDIGSGDKNRWRVGARVSPTYLSSNLKAANQNMSDLLTNENPILSYTGGFALSYSMGNRLSLQTGVYYSSLGREISGISSYSGFSAIAGSKSGRVFGVQTTSGTVNTTNRDIFLSDRSGNRIQSIYTSDSFDPDKANLTPFGTSLKQSFEYLEVPVILSYKVIDRKIDFNLLGGVSYNFLLDNKTYALSEESKVLVGSTEDMNSLLLSSAFGMSLEYSLSNRFSFNIEPTFRYYLNNDGRLSVENSYTFGVYSGLFFKF
jgi:hypothetical protein